MYAVSFRGGLECGLRIFCQDVSHWHRQGVCRCLNLCIRGFQSVAGSMVYVAAMLMSFVTLDGVVCGGISQKTGNLRHAAA